MAGNKKGKKISAERPVVHRGPTVEVPMMCYCTFKLYPHFHKTSNVETEPWNWDKTQAIWNKENAARKLKFKATGSPNN